MTRKPALAFLGLGVMGRPIAAHLARAGYDIAIYNRTTQRAQDLAAALKGEGYEVAIGVTPAEAAARREIIITCVGNDDDLAHVLNGPHGALSVMHGNVLIDHTTVSPGMARKVAKLCAARNIAAVDAPVSGGQAGAENAALAIMCGGTADAFAKAEQVMKVYGKTIVHIGEAGAGQTAKMANQMCIAGILGGLSEAIRLVQASGVDAEKVLAAISGGAAQSWQMDNRWPTMVAGEFDFGFAIDWMRKDLGYALQEAERLGLDSPVTQLVDTLYKDVQELDGGARQDTSALIRRLPLKSGNE
ncbi:NAD(P)-dependent oxidoreductase [Pontixanthobacter sp.]|uniref:NAD(P)-dependent oxidoreductase n=1 Tax=Pontixanthobacter sp. TaxID=2792078 RepID=UPI003C7E52B8